MEGTKTQTLTKHHAVAQDYTRLAVQAAQGAVPADVVRYGQQMRAGVQAELEELVREVLKAPIRKIEDLTAHLQRLPDYVYSYNPKMKVHRLKHVATGSRFKFGELKPGGVPMKEAYEQALQRTQQRDQAQIRQQDRNQGGGIGM